MNHEKEINEIRSLIDSINSSKNVKYPKTYYDEEFSEGVTYLIMSETHLSREIIVDCGETYKYYKHPLCLYVVDGRNVHPMTISDNPISIDGYNVPDDIKNFIIENNKLLTDFANMKIDSTEFFGGLKKWVDNKKKSSETT